MESKDSDFQKGKKLPNAQTKVKQSVSDEMIRITVLVTEIKGEKNFK